MAFATVLFDLDGTLTDSEPRIVASYRHALAAFGCVADDKAIRQWIGPPLAEGLSALGVPADELDQAVAIYRSYFGATGLHQNRLFDGVSEMLSRLRAAEVTLGLATSKLQEFAETILEGFGILGHFSVVAGASAAGSRLSKEDIAGFALDSLGHPAPTAAALVGDRKHDMLAARAHGLRAIGVAWGYGSLTELESAGCEVVAHDPAELGKLLLT